MSREYLPAEETKKEPKQDKTIRAFLISKQSHKGATKCRFIDLYEFNRTPYYECLLKTSQTRNLRHGSIIETDVNFKNITEIHMEHYYEIGVVLGNNNGLLLIYSKQKEPHYINVNINNHVGHDIKFAERGDMVLLNKSDQGEYYIAHNITTQQMKHSINQLTK